MADGGAGGTFRAFCSAVIWIITLPCAAFTLLCVTAWDAMRV